MRASTYHPTWINHSDCVKNGNITFSVNMPSPAWQANTLQVWAGSGTDCADNASRTGSAPTCWEIYSAPPTKGIAYSVRVRMQDIVGQHTNTETVHGPGSGIAADCETNDPNPVQVALYFMLVDASGQAVPGTIGTYTLAGDLLGPDAPTKTSVTSGVDSLDVDFTASQPLSDVVGYRLYSDLASFDAGCAAPGLQPGATPDDKYLSGKVYGATTTSGKLDGLTAGTRYAVAVAGFDGVENVGLPSNVACATPRHAPAMQESGGCSVAGHRGDARWLLALGLLAGFGALRRRG